MNCVEVNNPSLKYYRFSPSGCEDNGYLFTPSGCEDKGYLFTPPGCEDNGILKLEFVAKTQIFIAFTYVLII